MSNSEEAGRRFDYLEDHMQTLARIQASLPDMSALVAAGELLSRLAVVTAPLQAIIARVSSWTSSAQHYPFPVFAPRVRSRQLAREFGPDVQEQSPRIVDAIAVVSPPRAPARRSAPSVTDLTWRIPLSEAQRAVWDILRRLKAVEGRTASQIVHELGHRPDGAMIVDDSRVRKVVGELRDKGYMVLVHRSCGYFVSPEDREGFEQT